MIRRTDVPVVGSGTGGLAAAMSVAREGADVRGQARFDDSIGIYPEFIDGYGMPIIPTTGRYMHIPNRSMLPKGVRGLLVTGRAIGGDKIAPAATRNMACCAVAAQGARRGGDVAEVDMAAVQAAPVRQGVRIA